MAQDEQNTYRRFLRFAHASQERLNAGWLDTPATSSQAAVPDTVARVHEAVERLHGELGEVLLAAPQEVGQAAEELYSAVRASADAQFDLHTEHYGRGECLAALGEDAFRRHTDGVRAARDAYVQAVRQRSAAIEAASSDAGAAARALRAAPADAPWLITLSQRMPLHRIPHTLDRAVREALEGLTHRNVRFTHSGLAGAHRALVDALTRLVDEFGGTFAPDSTGPVTYTEVPQEWKRTDRPRYDEALAGLSLARDTVLNRYEELMTVMSSTGNLPGPDEPSPPPAQNFNVTSGDNSPVSLNAAYATGSATTYAGASPAPQSRGVLFWTAVGAVGSLAAAVIAYFALVK